MRRLKKMPWDKVLSKFKNNTLISGSSSGPLVKNRKQAIAIMLSEKKSTKSEYGPSSDVKTKILSKGKK